MKCKTCKGTIPAARLKAVPDAIRCTPCQSKAELAAKNGHPVLVGGDFGEVVERMAQLPIKEHWYQALAESEPLKPGETTS